MRLDKNKNSLRSYDDIFQEQIKLGIIEKVNSPGILKNVTCLPHREVVKENCNNKNTCHEIVKVADNPSLNDILYKGPCPLPKLYDLLLAFRAKQIALTRDRKRIFRRLFFMKTTKIFYVVYGLKINLIVNPLRFQLIVLLD